MLDFQEKDKKNGRMEGEREVEIRKEEKKLELNQELTVPSFREGVGDCSRVCSSHLVRTVQVRTWFGSSSSGVSIRWNPHQFVGTNSAI